MQTKFTVSFSGTELEAINEALSGTRGSMHSFLRMSALQHAEAAAVAMNRPIVAANIRMLHAVAAEKHREHYAKVSVFSRGGQDMSAIMREPVYGDRVRMFVEDFGWWLDGIPGARDGLVGDPDRWVKEAEGDPEGWVTGLRRLIAAEYGGDLEAVRPSLWSSL